MGVNSAMRLAGQVGILGRTSLRYSRSLIPSRRQVSMTDMIAAIRGPASSLPKCSQFLRLWKASHKRNYVKVPDYAKWECPESLSPLKKAKNPDG